MVICLERAADVHTAQLMPQPLTVFCFSKIQIGVAFLVPAHSGSPGQRAGQRVCVCTPRVKEGRSDCSRKTETSRDLWGDRRETSERGATTKARLSVPRSVRHRPNESLARRRSVAVHRTAPSWRLYARLVARVHGPSSRGALTTPSVFIGRLHGP